MGPKRKCNYYSDIFDTCSVVIKEGRKAHMYDCGNKLLKKIFVSVTEYRGD
jgi:hypothetical protein